MSIAVTELEAVEDLAAQGALFVLNDSGGKDSQAQRILVSQLVPRAQLLVVHAALGEVEWPGALEHARDGADRMGLPFIIATARRGLLQMVEDRFRTRPSVPSWPSSGQRQCTSDLKRGPCRREVRRFAAGNGFRIVVNCMGLRAEESDSRRKRATEPLRFDASQSSKRRAWWEWMPIAHLTTAEVFDTIAAAGESPHPAYAAGNDRLSCVFCILGNPRDARNGAVHRPELFARYVETERRTGYTVHQNGRGLEEFAGITVAEAFAQRRSLPVLQAGGAAC